MKLSFGCIAVFAFTLCTLFAIQAQTAVGTLDAQETWPRQTSPAVDQATQKSTTSAEPPQGSSNGITQDGHGKSESGDDSAPGALERRSRAISENVPLQVENIIGWPLPTALMENLDELAQQPATKYWARVVYTTFTELNQLELTDPAALPLLLYCEQLSDQLSKYAVSLSQTSPQFNPMAVDLSRVAYRIRRRIDIWKLVHDLAMRQDSDANTTHSGPVAQLIASRKIEFASQNVPLDWQDYLLLNRGQSVFEDKDASVAKRRAISRRILARTHSTSITSEQQKFAKQALGADLIGALREEAVGGLDLGDFLEHLEQFELESNAVNDFRVNDHFQTYYWHSDDDVGKLASAINNHYRNANIRLEVSEQFMNRLLPKKLNFQEPVKDRILGATVRGSSRISNQLQVDLIPDPQHLHLRFTTLGSVLSRTRAHHSSDFVFDNVGNARVNASKGIFIGAQGISLQPTNVAASSSQRLLDVRGRLDGVPLVGSLARRIAKQQQSAQVPQANKVVEQRLKTEFQSRVDKEIHQRITQAQQWFSDNIFTPFSELELEPTSLEMNTSDNHFVVRYRVAALDQLAANSARPQSQPGSLLSAQIHHTALNNFLNRVPLNGQRFTMDEFMVHLNQMLGRDDLRIPEEHQHDVTFEFASRDGLRVDFSEDRITLTLRLKKMRLGKGKTWRNLIVKAHYRPQAHGSHIHLIMDESAGISLSGYRLNFRDQLAARTVFATLFKPHLAFDIIPDSLAKEFNIHDLAITQLMVNDGWVGLSVSSDPNGSILQSQIDREQSPAWFPRASRLINRWR